jgi:ribosomal protein S18 acetylase RimI-like enzyme
MPVDTITIRRLGPEDAALVLAAPDDIFDNRPDPVQTRAFLAGPGNVLIAAFDGGRMVGFVSGCVLLHPDKPPSFFLNELGTAEGWRRRGIGLALTERILERARGMRCEGIWLGTETDNPAARATYRKAGGREHEGFVLFDWDGALD